MDDIKSGQLTRWTAAQQSVIGSMLVDDRCCGEVFQSTTAEMFGDATYRHIYEACRKVWTERQHLDPVLAMEACGSDGYAEVIVEAMRITPTAANVLEYCELCDKCLRLWNFRQAGFELLDCMTAEDAEAVWQRLGKQLMTGRKRRIYSYGEMMSGLFDRLDDEKPPNYIDWGFQPLNEVMTISAGNFIVLGAQSSVGKTALALQLARHMAECGKYVGFFSLETVQEDAADRLMANGARVPLPAIKHHRVSSDDLKRMVDDAQRMYSARFDLIEAAGYTVADIESDTIARGYDTIFVDYVQIVQAGRADDDAPAQVRRVSIALHALALRLKCTVIALSQVTIEKPKGGSQRHLTKMDLRESQQLANDAQAVLLMELSDPEDYSSDRILIVDKNKDGACGTMALHFNAPLMRFEYVPPYEDAEISAARARNEKMNKNREARQLKAKRAEGIEGQVNFKELPDDGEEIPF